MAAKSPSSAGESTRINVAVLSQKVDDLKDDVKEVKTLVSDKIATKEYVDDRINPLKRLVYWQLGIVGVLVAAMVTVILGQVLGHGR